MRITLPDQVSYVEHASDIIAFAAGLIAQQRPFALITSIAIEGGAAREIGSLALVDNQGEMTGYLSNGCIDQDIRIHAQNTLVSQEPTVIRYGEGSHFADLKLPCGGALSVLINPRPDVDAIMAAHDKLLARTPAVINFKVLNLSNISFSYRPKFRLVLAGRGAVFRSMAEIAKLSGFQVFALSPDTDDLASLTPITDIPPIHLTTPSQSPSLSQLDEDSAFLTLFHDHDWEPELLRAALATQVHFIGSLGSVRTHEARRAHLAQAGVHQVDLARLIGPIGLVSSLREAPLIAISAMAEIVGNLPKSIQILEACTQGSPSQ